MPETSLLVGSVPVSGLEFTWGGGGSVAFPDGTYYLRHPTAGISLIDTLASELSAEAGAAVTVTVQPNLRVRIQQFVSAQITLSARLRALLGFTGPLGTSNSFTAQEQSPLLWAAGFRATPGSRAGKVGYKVPHVTRHKSDDGTRQETQYFGEEVWQELEWPFIPAERLSHEDGESASGTFEAFYEEVLKFGRRFHYYESIQEVQSLGGIIWTTNYGPYQLRDDVGNPNWYDRVRANTDEIGGGLAMEMHVTDEVSNA